MNREEFMAKLKKMLAGIPVEEQEEALQYYEDYFDDAGAENEADVILELGDPKKVAHTIRENLKNGSDECGEFTERGFEDERFEKKESPARREDIDSSGRKSAESAENRYSYAGDAQEAAEDYNYKEQTEKAAPRTSKALKIVLIILIVFAAVPAVFPAAAAVIGVVLALILAAFGLFLGLFIGAAAVALSGIVIVVAGMIKMFSIPAGALLTVGIGLIIFVIGLIATVATARLCMVMYPAIFRIVVNLIRKPFHRKAVDV